jgi:hypothetical protein
MLLEHIQTACEVCCGQPRNLRFADLNLVPCIKGEQIPVKSGVM